MKKILVVVVALFLLVGCASKNDMTKVTTKTLNNNSYVLVGSLSQAPVVLKFSEDRVVGNTGVNTFFADYELVEDSIMFKNPASTKAMGEPTAMAQEDQFLKDMSEASTITFANEMKAVIIKTTSQKELVFNKIEE